MFLVQDDIAIAVKLIDAQFPPYDQMIPRHDLEAPRKRAIVSRHAAWQGVGSRDENR